MTCQPLRSGQEATSRYPPPNTVILTNLCNALLSRPDFYVQVLDAASRNSLSCIYLRKTPLSLSHHRLRGIWMTTEGETEDCADTVADSSEKIHAMNHDSFKSAKPVKSKKRIPINTKHRFDFNLKTENLSKTSTIVVPEPQDRPKPIGLPKLSEERDLLFHRLKDSDFPCFPVFSDYKKGRSSHKLYVKNISKNVTRDELTQIYSSLLDKEVKRQPFGVRHFTTGKLRGQAFVTLPDKKLASRARRLTNGLMLKGKPIVVVFGKDEKKNS